MTNNTENNKTKEHILKIENIQKSFKSSSSKPFQIHPFSISLNKGEIISLVGESGSGKTTLLRIIAGFEWADSGCMYLKNRILFNQSNFLVPEKRNIGFIFQDNSLFPHLSTKDNICYGITSLSTQEKEKRLGWILHLMELNHYEKTFPHELSGGEQQRVAIARSLVTHPDLLLLDEPFNNLDPIIQNKIRSEICHLFKKINTTAIFVSHQTKDALPISDRIVIIRQGKLQQIDTPQQIYQHPNNGYIASFFGACNFFKNPSSLDMNSKNAFKELISKTTTQNDASHFIRAENFCISTTKIKNHTKTIVLSSLFYGQYREVTVSTTESNIPLIIHLSNQLDISSGDIIYIRPKQNAIYSIN